MPTSPRLSREALQFLATELGKSPKTVKNGIAKLRQTYATTTMNAAAQLYAEQHSVSVRRFLTKEDKRSMPPVKLEEPHIIKRKKVSRERELIPEVIHFDTNDPFLSKHIKEINRAVSKGCYTCVFVLTRKVFENLIISILRSRFPSQRDLIYDSHRQRYLDFSIVLTNLYKNREQFGDEKKSAIDRLNQKLKPFRIDSNDKAHSLYHIVETRKEIDDWTLDTIMDLIKEIM